MTTVFLSSVIAAFILSVGFLGLERFGGAGTSQSRKGWSMLIIIIVLVAVIVLFGLILFGMQGLHFARLSHRFA